ncbi:MAG TPA: stage 0 sporulation family protein [Bacilli bacterium]|nr:stage 0 sporulation family protein [Bacilli bacterium]
MRKVLGINFSNSNKIYYFEINKEAIEKGNNVIVETEKGLQFGSVATGIIEVDETKLSSPIKSIIRLATEEDEVSNEKNLKDAEKALNDANDIVNELGLEMKILNASFTFDRRQLLFYFLADERIDFRVLAKKLAKIYCTRIELRQIGVRDKAKIVGGYGQCGRQLCCHLFLSDLNAVSINMAKNQNLALNPQKINGCCGRLMCCLNYENDIYDEGKKKMLKVGTYIDTPQGKGKIVAVDVVANTYKVDVAEKGIVIVDGK